MLKERLQNIPLGVKAAVVYTMASVFSRGLSMITVPIFTRIMSIQAKLEWLIYITPGILC